MSSKSVSVETRSMDSDGAGVLRIPGSIHRVAIIISVPAGGTAFIQPGGGDGKGGGIQINANVPYMEFTSERYGDATKEPFTVINAAGASMTFGVAEFMEAL